MCWVLSRLRAELGWQPPVPGPGAGEELPCLWLSAGTHICTGGCSSGNPSSLWVTCSKERSWLQIAVLKNSVWCRWAVLWAFHSWCLPSPPSTTVPVSSAWSHKQRPHAALMEGQHLVTAWIAADPQRCFCSALQLLATRCVLPSSFHHSF